MTPPLPNIKIKFDAMGMGSVMLNDQVIPGTYAVSIQSRVQEITRVTIELYAQTIEIEAPADVALIAADPHYDGRDEAIEDVVSRVLDRLSERATTGHNTFNITVPTGLPQEQAQEIMRYIQRQIAAR